MKIRIWIIAAFLGAVFPVAALAQMVPFANWQTTGATCTGASVGSYCWYAGSTNQSCDTVCAAQGTTCDLTGTKDYAGSGGSNANCLSVLTALGIGSGGVSDIEGEGGSFVVGCINYDGTRYRVMGPATTCASSDGEAARACACVVSGGGGGGGSCPSTDASCNGSSSGMAGLTCKTIKGGNPSSTDGTYWIKPSSTAYQAYCDMTNNGGGWTLVAYQGNSRAHISASEVASWSGISTTSSTAGKYSDTQINAILNDTNGHNVIRVTGSASGSTHATINYNKLDVWFWSISNWSATSASTGGGQAYTTYNTSNGALTGADGGASGSGWVGVSHGYSSGWSCNGAYGYTSGGLCAGNAASHNGWVYSCDDCQPAEHMEGTYKVWAK